MIIGAPKAGTTALHAALSSHPDVFMSTPKEPKYWLCDDAPPPAWRGPGDAHSQQEWVWLREDYQRLFDGAGGFRARGESTPFYLWSRGAHRRIAEGLPDVRLIAVVRDPIDRAYSNWMHLWSDGLEPVGDFEEALALQDERIARGWAPFWRYRDLGHYGAQLQHLRRYVDPSRILVMRYRTIVDEPRAAVDRACHFLGIRQGQVATIPEDNARSYVEPGWRPRVIGPVVRAGAWAGSFAPPDVWRRASAPLVAQLAGTNGATRPDLSAEARLRLIPSFADDVALLTELTGEDFSDWLSPHSRGAYRQRTQVTRSWAPSGRAASR
ncbi:sulfotransferase [Nocardioides euryhalodurans]|uniref:Sulfotransferase n=1 Tax=Nocardioides euryhalodurans TaxID=2518370 RepID=A0A4P7GR29_9ACTN|nr:sulfotransferase [Nocardioides euryhalodurans]